QAEGDQRPRPFGTGEGLDLEAVQRQRLLGARANVVVVFDQQDSNRKAFTHVAAAPGGLALGRSTVKHAPPSSRLAARSVPPAARTSCAEITRPRPSPAPAGLLLTKGSNRRARMSARMPGPVSVTVRITRSPWARASTRRSRCGAPCIASIALRIRLLSRLPTMASS